MLTTQWSEEKMFCGLSPPSAVAVVATVVMLGGGAVTDATASLSASISVASCRAACLHVVSLPLHSSLRALRLFPLSHEERSQRGPRHSVREGLERGHAAAREPP